MTKLESLVESAKAKHIADTQRDAAIAKAAESITWEYHDWIADIKSAIDYGADRADILNAAVVTIEEYIKTLGLEGADALIAYRRALRYEINGGFDNANSDRPWYPARRILCDIYENASLWHSLDWDTSEGMCVSLTYNSKENPYFGLTPCEKF